MRYPRTSGILLHPTSLPGPFGSGDIGASSYHFVDWLVSAGQSVWQMLPVSPIGFANSPYMSLSAFAGNTLLIDLQDLVARGWLKKNELEYDYNFPASRVDYPKTLSIRIDMLEKAAKRFFEIKSHEDLKQFETFCKRENYWLDHYSLFQALNKAHNNSSWTGWEQALVHFESPALKKALKELDQEILTQKFLQWCFNLQWASLKRYANEKGIKLVGDIPIFVSHHSADVWSQQDCFYLDKNGTPKVVAGVPPDYFSKTGQRWGNPLYRWKKMKENKYAWWVKRFQRTLELFDIIRIDHFRGFESYWEINEKEPDATRGRWAKGPGLDFFKTIKRKLGDLPIVAEDLGMITDEVHRLRRKLDFPGMKVLQFAFSGGPENNYLPHNIEQNSVVYTGTHDNDTTCGWYEKATEHERDFIKRYCPADGKRINWEMIKLALSSAADTAIIPFQDVIGLGSEGRMNFPGTIPGNWEWRYTWDQVGPEPARILSELAYIYGRRSKI